MQVEHLWRICEGRKILEKGSDIPLAIALVPGYQSLRDGIISLERATALEPSHPSGAAWQFRFCLDYHPSGEPQAMKLEILPKLARGNHIPAIRIVPGQTLSLEFLGRYIRKHLPVRPELY